VFLRELNHRLLLIIRYLKVNLEPINSLRGFLKLCAINIPASVLLGHGISKGPELGDILPTSLQSLHITHYMIGVREKLAELAKIFSSKLTNSKVVEVPGSIRDNELRKAFLEVGVESTDLDLN
jgi:hypothetical protein